MIFVEKSRKIGGAVPSGNFDPTDRKLQPVGYNYYDLSCTLVL